jgi:hypothetical protein
MGTPSLTCPKANVPVFLSNPLHPHSGFALLTHAAPFLSFAEVKNLDYWSSEEGMEVYDTN